jgi:flagellar assembly protein FliH
VDVEKNSLNNTPDEEDSGDKNCFKLHYFPEIPITRDSKESGGVGKKDDFRRIECEGIEDFPGVSFRESRTYEEHLERSRQSDKERSKKTYDKGYRDGERAGITSEKKKLESLLNSLHQVLLELDGLKMEAYRNCEKEIVGLALAVAEKIIRLEVGTRREVVANVVKETLKRLLDHDNIKIRVNPSDYELLKNEVSQFSGLVENLETIIFEEDNSIDCGGCIIETNLGDIDARIEKQIQAVEEAFKAELQKSTFSKSSNFLK